MPPLALSEVTIKLPSVAVAGTDNEIEVSETAVYDAFPETALKVASSLSVA